MGWPIKLGTRFFGRVNPQTGFNNYGGKLCESEKYCESFMPLFKMLFEIVVVIAF
jgi:hypothetical protein